MLGTIDSLISFCTSIVHMRSCYMGQSLVFVLPELVVSVFNWCMCAGVSMSELLDISAFIPS